MEVNFRHLMGNGILVQRVWAKVKDEFKLNITSSPSQCKGLWMHIFTVYAVRLHHAHMEIIVPSSMMMHFQSVSSRYGDPSEAEAAS